MPHVFLCSDEPVHLTKLNCLSGNYVWAWKLQKIVLYDPLVNTLSHVFFSPAKFMQTTPFSIILNLEKDVSI